MATQHRVSPLGVAPRRTGLQPVALLPELQRRWHSRRDLNSDRWNQNPACCLVTPKECELPTQDLNLDYEGQNLACCRVTPAGIEDFERGLELTPLVERFQDRMS